jgi:hypothetical protein
MPGTPRKVKRTKRAPGTKFNTKYNWKALLDDWQRSDLKLGLGEFAALHSIPLRTLSCKQLEVEGKMIYPFRAAWRKEFHQRHSLDSSTIRADLDNVPVSRDKHFIRALEQGKVLCEHIMKKAAEGFDALSTTPFEYTSPGEAARVAMAAASTLRELCLDLQGIPQEDEEYGWPVTKGFWPFPYQRDFIFDLPSTLRATGEDVFLFGFIGGIGSGKTRAGAEKFGDLCWRNRGVTGAIFGPTYRMLEDATKPMFFKVLASKGLSYKYRASENSITLFGDTKVLFRSMDNPEHLRGPQYGHFWMDEAGQLADAAAFNIVMGRMREAKAAELCGIITTTPDGLNWLYDELVTKQRENRVKLYHGTSEQNVALPSGYVDRLKALYDERFYAQEVLGKWIDIFAGQAYWNFDRAQSVSDEFDYDPSIPIALCVDFNVDPMCWNIIQQRRYRDGRIIDTCFDEIHVRTASTEVTCREFLNRYGKHKAGVNVHGDATGHSRTTAATRTDYQIIQEMLSKAIPAVEICTGRYNPGVTDSISAVNARLKNAAGVRSFFVHPRCTQTIRDFERVSFVSGTRELDKSQKDLTHHSDATRYYLYSLYPVRKPQVVMQGAR